MEYLEEELKKLPKEIQDNLEIKDLSFFLEDYEYYIKDSNLGEDDELTYEDEI